VGINSRVFETFNLLKKSCFHCRKYFYNFQNDPQPEHPKMSVLLRGGSFFLTTTTDNNNHNHDFYSVLSKVFCISQLIVLPFAASSLITSPGLRNFYHHFFKSFWFFSFIPSTQQFSLISAKITSKIIHFCPKMWYLRNALRNQRFELCKMKSALMWRLLFFSFFYLFLYSKIPWLWRILEKTHTFLFNKT